MSVLAGSGGLGRRAPSDWTHVQKYSLADLPTAEIPSGVPIAIGINWYSNFDEPVKGSNNRWWIGRGNLGSVRGGHCVCVKGVALDYYSWWDFYNQGAEGACVGFGTSRVMSLLNRKRYAPRWLWDQAKLVDEWSDTNPGDDNGTSVRAAYSVLRSLGHVAWKSSYLDTDDDWHNRQHYLPTLNEGISAYRWATTAEQMMTVINSPDAQALGAFPIFNSWGRDYPHKVWMPAETMQRLLDEDGEAGLATDR